MATSVISPPEAQGSSTRPYLIRALHAWCTDNGFTPYLAVHVDASVRVPLEYVKNGEIVLNTSFDATSSLELGNEFVSFKARFGGVPREIMVPVDHVIAIYARENGQGMAFPAPAGTGAVAGGAPVEREVPSLADGSAAELPRPTAARSSGGLRLATPPAQPPAVVEEPPEPPSGGPRPTLKRVK
jgi:stringent starvation protein B